MDKWHVIPLGDLREHQDTADCWCCPDVHDEEAGQMIVHHAMDGREAYETGQRLPN